MSNNEITSPMITRGTGSMLLMACNTRYIGQVRNNPSTPGNNVCRIWGHSIVAYQTVRVKKVMADRLNQKKPWMTHHCNGDQSSLGLVESFKWQLVSFSASLDPINTEVNLSKSAEN